jgi:hypothetical protein
MSYERGFALKAFFHVKDVPEDRIGGWFVEGMNERDEYDEFVIPRPKLKNEDWARLARWREWIRQPIEIGDPLLNPIMAGGNA